MYKPSPTKAFIIIMFDMFQVAKVYKVKLTREINFPWKIFCSSSSVILQH